MLLILHDADCRAACHDYFDAQGCLVDTAAEDAEAETLLRFHDYDMVVADLPLDARDHKNTLRLLELARRRSAQTRRVLLTTQAECVATDSDVIVLVKPHPLDAILLVA